MQYANINGEKLEYNVQGNREGEAVLIHGGILADIYVLLVSQPILASAYLYSLYNYARNYGNTVSQ